MKKLLHVGSGSIRQRIKKLSSSNFYSAVPELEDLERIYSNHSCPLFKLKLLGTHEKFLVCDRSWAMLGSHNFLTIAVLGAMKELGSRSHQLHQQVGETVHELKLDALMVLNDGVDTQDIVQSARGIPTECFATHAELVAGLKEFVKQGDRILFKAAHSVGLDRVVNQFRAEFSRSL